MFPLILTGLRTLAVVGFSGAAFLTSWRVSGISKPAAQPETQTGLRLSALQVGGIALAGLLVWRLAK